MALGKLMTALEHVLAIGGRSDSASDAASSTLVSLLRMLMKASRTAKGYLVRKTIAFDGTEGKGAQGTITLFTVTGTIRVTVTAFCSENLAGATATLAVGIAGATASLIAQATATDIDAGEIWHDATPDASIELDSVAGARIVTNGADVIATVATADITDGTLLFVAEWEPLSTDGALVAA